MTILPSSACLFARFNENIMMHAMMTVDTQMAMTAMIPGR